MRRIQIPEPRPIRNFDGVVMKETDDSPAMASMRRLLDDRLRDAKWGLAGYDGLVMADEIRGAFEKADGVHFDIPDGHHAFLVGVIKSPSPPTPLHPGLLSDPMVGRNFVPYMRAIVEAKPVEEAEQ